MHGDIMNHHSVKGSHAAILDLVSDDFPEPELESAAVAVEPELAVEVDELIADAPEDRHSLLDELQALKRVLSPSSIEHSRRSRQLNENLDLAILDDVVSLEAAERVTHSNLLDLNAIFDEENGNGQQADSLRIVSAGLKAATPNIAGATSISVQQHPEKLRLMVQEIVDELVPVLEDQLRQRLLGLSSDAILELADSILDS